MPARTPSSGFEGYAPEVRKALEKLGLGPGERACVESEGKAWEGLVMPRIVGDPSILVLKLDNGYNVGVKVDAKTKISRGKEARKEVRKAAEDVHPGHKAKALPHDPNKPTITILHTGGTVASKLDYRTGAVQPIFTAEDLVEMYPELKEIANIRARVIFQMFSEDMESEHWAKLAREISQEISIEGTDGIIVTHGTDTMHYTAAALAFAMQNLPVPVLLTGAQRSSDRPSSDAGMNLVCAARFIAGTDWSGVGVCMHGSPGDDFCWILPATRVRKMHTSRRDTFRPINATAIAKVHWRLNTIEMLAKGYPKKDASRLLKLDNTFEGKVALVKLHPGFKAEALEWYAKNCKGIVLEGTGLGHAPINHVDEATAHHPKLLEKIKEMTKAGVAVYMASQCLYGRVNMNIYSTGRDLLVAGVRPSHMLSEVALVKLGWALGKTKDPKKLDELMQKDVAGELLTRTEHDVFPDEGMENRIT
jgi:glutamyl-tRNA(Gln) amidotransferase subunit D